MKLIFAGAKDKIRTYKITDPHLKAFIFKYESLIDWNAVKTQDDINTQIKDVLMKDIYAMIDQRQPEKNHYIKPEHIDLEKEFERNMDDPAVKKAYKFMKRDPEHSKQIIADSINENKKTAFDQWWKYITTEEIYKKSPAFQYMILRPIFESSPANRKNGPLGQNALAISMVFGEIQNGGQINVGKAYKNALVEVDTMEVGKSQIDAPDGWIRIPSMISDPDNFDSNVQKLKNLSIPRGWCTGRTHARQYLAKGDFWLYIEDKEARVAIRFDGERIAEIQGHQNYRPFEYWEQVVDLIESKGFDKENAHYKELEKAKLINQSLDLDPNYLESFKKRFRENPDIYKMLSKERQESEEFLNLAVEYWQDLLLDDEKNQHSTARIDKFNRCPKNVKYKMDKEVYEKIFLEMTERSSLGADFLSTYNKKSSDFLKMGDYAKRYSEWLLKSVQANPWLTAFLDYKVVKQLPEDFKKSLEDNQSYQMILDLETVEIDNLNPEEIIEKYMGHNFDDVFEDKTQEGLDELYQEHLEYDPESTHKEIYDEALVDHIQENTMNYWYDYVSADVENRFEELEGVMTGHGRYSYDDGSYEEIRNMYEEHWRNYIYENPEKTDYIPSDWVWESIFWSHSAEENEWYIDAWVNKVNEDFDRLQEARDKLNEIFMKDAEFIEHLYQGVFSPDNTEQIKAEMKINKYLLIDEDELMPLKSYTNFLENNEEFIKETLLDLQKSKELSASELFEAIEFYEDDLEIELFEEEEKVQIEELVKEERLEKVRQQPWHYQNITPWHLRDDPEFIKAWHSTEEKWLENLDEYNVYDMLRAMPEEVKNSPKIQEKAAKMKVMLSLKSELDSVFKFDMIMQPYKNDAEFYENMRKRALNLYYGYLKRQWQYLGNAEEVGKRLGKVPNVALRDENVMERFGKELASDMASYRLDQLDGDELAAIDSRLLEYMMPHIKRIAENLDYKSYRLDPRRLRKSCNYIQVPYERNPGMFQDVYNKFKADYLRVIGTEAYGEQAIRFLPKLFMNDPDVIQAVKQHGQGLALGDAPDYVQQMVQEENRIEKPAELDINRPIMTKDGLGRLVDYEDGRPYGHSLVLEVQLQDGTINKYIYEGEGISDVSLKPVNEKNANWYRSYKRSVFSQNAEMIDSFEVEGIIRGFGSRRFTIGYRKKDGSFRVMNAQRKVKRPYGDQGSFGDVPEGLLVVYDLQIASQIAREAVNDINVDELPAHYLKRAYRRIYPESVEFIKGDGAFYVVEGSDYAIENGL
jgi:hypothetical protein